MTYIEQKFPQDFLEECLNIALHGSETKATEMKRVSGKMVTKALETICAFANTKGGLLFLGVEDPDKAKGQDRLYGIDETPVAIDELIRKLETQFLPKIEKIMGVRIPCKLRDGKEGSVLVLIVPPSDKVHSILDDGTWMRADKSNREMSASEITELSYRRGVRSAESEPVDVDFDLLETETWRQYAIKRGLSNTGIADQLHRIGLARKVDNVLRPMRAAVLLFADHPGALLAPIGSRADVRVFHYRGNAKISGEIPNLLKPPKTLSGPIYHLIEQTREYVFDALAEGLTMPNSGFETAHRYPERVVKEAITNALIHRDYRLNQDVHIRIFDNRLEIESPGLFPGRITASNIHKSGSFARNPSIVNHLRDFPIPPNADANEGVPMMFSVMRENNRYPPQYRVKDTETQQAIVLTLLNEERPSVWEQVSDWIDRNGPIGNRDVCKITGMDTLKASKQLKLWLEKGMLESNPVLGKRNRVYNKPSAEAGDLLSIVSDNKLEKPTSSLDINKLENVYFPFDANRMARTGNLTQVSPPLSERTPPLSERTPPLSSPSSTLPADDPRWAIVAPMWEKKKVKPEVMQAAILMLCAENYLTLQQLAALLNRGAKGLQEDHLAPLTRAGRLQLRFPDNPNHPHQAYRAASAAER